LLVKDAVKGPRPDAAPYPASLKSAANDVSPAQVHDAAPAVEAETQEG